MQKKSFAANLSFATCLKYVLFMKLLVICLTAFCLQATATGYSQNRITITSKDMSLKKIFSDIQAQTNYIFLYHESENLNNIKLNLAIKGMRIEDALHLILANTPVSYKITGNNLVLISTDASTNTGFVIKGRIVNENGEPLKGVSVSIQDKQGGTTTDNDGYFSIEVERGDVLLFSMVGMMAQEAKVNNDAPVYIVLKAVNNNMEEVVVVGYGTQKREEVTGSIATVKGSELAIAPVGNVTNALAGRLAGLVSVQTSGQPGYDKAALSVRGFGSPLLIVDGVEADFTTLDPNTIESVSVLKDASASIYGARAGNGVILVTTKKGLSQKPTLTFNTSLTGQSVTVMPKPVSAGQFATLSREGYLNSGQNPQNAPYTEEQIAKYYAGTDPQYPNTNWYDVVFRDWAPQQQHNVSVRGGSDKIKYYGFLGFLDQQTMLKKGGSGYKRYNLISNIDAQISDQLSFAMNLNSNFGLSKYPWRGLGSENGSNAAWEDFWNTQPVYPASLPDPTKLSWAVGSNTGGAHIMANRDIAGYNDYTSFNTLGTLALNYTSKIIKGLSAKALFNYNFNYGSRKNFQRPVDFYTYNYDANTYTKVGSLGSQASLSLRESKGRVLTGQLSIGYDKKIGAHQVSFLGLHEIIDYYDTWVTAGRTNFLTSNVEEIFGGSTQGMKNDGSTAEMGRKSYIARLSYNYDVRYLLDINFRADASAKFPKEKRWGYFPGVTVGWRINKENFMANLANLDELKLRLSYGTTGNDDVGNFMYISGFKVSSDITQGMSYLFGNTTASGITSLGLANPAFTWEKNKIYNAGIDFSLWKRKLYGVLDVFYREKSGIPAYYTTALPGTFGATPPLANLNSLNNRGFELKLGTAGVAKDLSWDVSGNISWTRDKWVHYEEPEYTDPASIRISKKSGRWTDIVYGYKSDGLFTSQKEIDNLGYNQDLNPTKPNASLRPGDIKYVDVNQDGIIDRNDMVELGKGTTPHWMFGLAPNLKYRQFDLSLLFQGAFGYYTLIKYTGGVPPEIMYKERWTEQNNNAHALIPRSGGKGFDRVSDYNYKNASYVRLKTMALGYTLPRTLSQKAGLNDVRAFLATTNLLTFDKLKKYDIDPEAPSALAGHYYPQQKTISVGLNISL